jgi:hypothetical protein
MPEIFKKTPREMILVVGSNALNNKEQLRT